MPNPALFHNLSLFYNQFGPFCHLSFGAGRFTQGCCSNFRFINVSWCQARSCCGATHRGCHNWINLTLQQSWCSNIIWPCKMKTNKSACCWQCQDGHGCSRVLLWGRDRDWNNEILVSSLSFFFVTQQSLKDFSVSSDSKKLPALSIRWAWSLPRPCCCQVCQQKQAHHFFGSLRDFQ